MNKWIVKMIVKTLKTKHDQKINGHKHWKHIIWSNQLAHNQPTQKHFAIKWFIWLFLVVALIIDVAYTVSCMFKMFHKFQNEYFKLSTCKATNCIRWEMIDPAKNDDIKCIYEWKWKIKSIIMNLIRFEKWKKDIRMLSFTHNNVNDD